MIEYKINLAGRVQTVPWGHTASYPVGTRGYFCVSKAVRGVKMIIYPHLVLRLIRRRGFLHPIIIIVPEIEPQSASLWLVTTLIYVSRLLSTLLVTKR
jgi:hypothetical protein